MEDIILVNKRGAPIYLGNQFKLVPGRNRFTKEVFERVKLVKGYETFLKAGSLQIIDPNQKAKAVDTHEERPVIPAPSSPVVVDTSVTAPPLPRRKVKRQQQAPAIVHAEEAEAEAEPSQG